MTTRIYRAALPIAGPDVLAMCCAAATFFIIRFKLIHEPHRIAEVIKRSHALDNLVG